MYLGICILEISMKVHKVQHTSGDGCVQQWEGILGPIHILAASIVQEQYMD